jgi:hypothetical protein
MSYFTNAVTNNNRMHSCFRIIIYEVQQLMAIFMYLLCFQMLCVRHSGQILPKLPAEAWLWKVVQLTTPAICTLPFQDYA